MRWKREGFISDSAARSKGKETPINLLGFKDGTANPASHDLSLIHIFILLFFTIYCASGIVAGARLFESTFGMSYETALWAGAAATIIYTFVGGFLAVSWTDTVQASLMIFARCV